MRRPLVADGCVAGSCFSGGDVDVIRTVLLSLVQLLSVAAVAAGVSMLVHIGAGLIVLGTAGLYASWQWDRAAGP